MPKRVTNDEELVEEGAAELEIGEIIDNAVTVSINNPKSRWGLFGHVNLTFSVSVPDLKDVFPLYVALHDLMYDAVQNIEDEYKEELEEYFSKFSEKSGDSSRSGNNNGNFQPTWGLSKEQYAEYCEICEERGWDSKKKIWELASEAGVYLRKVKPGSEEAEDFLDFIRNYSSGSKSRRARRSNPYR